MLKNNKCDILRKKILSIQNDTAFLADLFHASVRYENQPLHNALMNLNHLSKIDSKRIIYYFKQSIRYQKYENVFSGLFYYKDNPKLLFYLTERCLLELVKIKQFSPFCKLLTLFKELKLSKEYSDLILRELVKKAQGEIIVDLYKGHILNKKIKFKTTYRCLLLLVQLDQIKLFEEAINTISLKKIPRKYLSVIFQELSDHYHPELLISLLQHANLQAKIPLNIIYRTKKIPQVV